MSPFPIVSIVVVVKLQFQIRRRLLIQKRLLPNMVFFLYDSTFLFSKKKLVSVMVEIPFLMTSLKGFVFGGGYFISGKVFLFRLGMQNWFYALVVQGVLNQNCQLKWL